MAIQKEIWVEDLVGNLFADNTFASRFTNHSAFVVAGKTVHVPNAGAKPTVTKNRTTFPATVTSRTDVDVNYDLDAFSTAPIRIPNIETYELSYDKRTSVLNSSKEALQETVHTSLLTTLATHVANGNKSIAATFSKAALLAIMTAFDKADVSHKDRCIILTPDAYSQLLAELTDAEKYNLLGAADAARGILGRLYGFDIYERSVVDSTASSKVSAIAWQENCVGAALGAVDIYVDEDSATMYGDVISAEVRAGGDIIRNDKAGVYVVTTA